MDYYLAAKALCASLNKHLCVTECVCLKAEAQMSILDPSSVVNVQVLSAACQNSGQREIAMAAYLDMIFFIKKCDPGRVMIHPNNCAVSKSESSAGPFNM